jgi:hypothetical protein
VVAIAGIGIGVSDPAPFTYDNARHAYEPLPQAGDDVDRLRLRLLGLAAEAGVAFEMDVLKGSSASRSAILSSLEKSIGQLDQGGLFILVLEGHGDDVPDLDGDEKALGHEFDQVFPTADEPILDDDLWEIWRARPDITVFSIADTCRAETLTVKVMADLVAARSLGVLAPVGLTACIAEGPPITLVITEEGPELIQFAASSRGTDAGDVILAGKDTGRFTQAVIAAAREPAALESYRSWFELAHRIVRNSSADQFPKLYYMGPDQNAISRQPAFLAPDRL